MENPIKMDDLGVPLFQETPILEHWNGNSSTVTFFLTDKSVWRSSGSECDLESGITMNHIVLDACGQQNHDEPCRWKRAIGNPSHLCTYPLVI